MPYIQFKQGILDRLKLDLPRQEELRANEDPLIKGLPEIKKDDTEEEKERKNKMIESKTKCHIDGSSFLTIDCSNAPARLEQPAVLCRTT